MQTKTMINLKGAALATAVNMSSTPSVYVEPTHHRSKFTPHDIIMIKLLHHFDRRDKNELAEMYNVAPLTIYKIIRQKTHKNIPLNHMTKVPEEFHVMTNYKYFNCKIKGHK
jgi:hypothetical protein